MRGTVEIIWQYVSDVTSSTYKISCFILKKQAECQAFSFFMKNTGVVLY